MINNIDTGWNLENSYSHLPKIFYTSLNPTPVSSPKLVILNNKLAESLGLNNDYLKSEHAIDILLEIKFLMDLFLLHRLTQVINLGILQY